MAAAHDPVPDDPYTAYTDRLNARRAAHATEAHQHRQAGTLRLLTLGAAAALGVAILGGLAVSGWWLLAPLAVVVGLGFVLDRLETRRDRLARAIAFFERAIARLEGHWAGAGDTGARFLDERHLYARDLDLFGDGSLFQFLTHARTRMGEETLAAWLLAPADPETVVARQDAVRELASKLDLREDLAVLGEDASTGVRPDALAAWGEQRELLPPTGLRWAARILSVFGVLSLGGGVTVALAAGGSVALTDGVATALRAAFFLALVGNGTALWRLRHSLGGIFGAVTAAAQDLNLLAGVLRRLEDESFRSPRLVALQTALEVDGDPPSRQLARLSRLMEYVDSRHNFFARILGLFVLWDVHLAYAVEAWRRTSGAALRRWLDAVGEMEALSSIASFRYECPGTVFPTLVTDTPVFDATALAHPLLDQRAVANDVSLTGAPRAVANDVSLAGTPQVLVVSGSNMSGKSTFLRTVGINAVLAQAGAPVRARELRLSTLGVGASIRLLDSLQEGTSRFYAEIMRLRQIMDAAGARPPVLFLIDELLHGTNSHDRRVGAAAIVGGLADRGAIGLVTTHDLALTEIADTLASGGANVHFADHLENGRLRFDYRMRPGVVEKSNAVELMRSVGLDV